MRVMTAPPADPDRGPETDPGAGPPAWWETDTPEAGPLDYERAASDTPDDPDPARMPGAPPPGPVVVTAAVRKDIEGKLAFWAGLGIDIWNMADPYCAGVAADNVDKMARNAAPLVCQSPQLVEFFSRASGFMLWTKFGMSCKPVIAAVIAHHVTKRVQLVRAPDGQEQPQEADWSAYTAA